jgi:TonB-linked SusC/RagA family outer membrane protein
MATPTRCRSGYARPGPVLLLLTLLALSLAAAPARAQQGTITGRVTDATTGQPLPTVMVGIAGTNIGTPTNQSGVYTIQRAPAGTVTLRVRVIGYAEQTRQVAVAADATTTADFALQPAAIQLEGIVTTVTGEQRKVEIGHAVSQVKASDIVPRSAVTNVGDLLTSRAPGVMVTPGTQTGAGVRIRIRGTSSLSLTNNPIVVIDGVRMEGTTGSSSVSVGGTTPSRLGDLNPSEIESMEIVRGPSAATLYGTDAANGVIVITTKKGIAGKPQWTYYTEQTAIRDLNDYPTAYRGWRSGSTSSNLTQCFLTQHASGACAQDSVTSFNVAADPETTPFGTGYRQQHGLQLRGGTESIRYFLHGEWESEDGVTQLPKFERRYLAANNLSLSPDQRKPNGMDRVTARMNLNIVPSDKVDVAVNTGYITSDLRLVRGDDSGTAGVTANIYGGPGFKYNTNVAGDTLWGWREFTPRKIYQTETQQAIERFISSASSNWRPTDWLTLRGSAGVDYINRLDTQICRFGECTTISQENKGFKRDNRTNFHTYTVDAGATAKRQVTGDLGSETSLGVQFYRNIFDANYITGRELAPGSSSLSSAAVKLADDNRSESRTLGSYLEQRFAYRDRLFVTGAVRSDRNSAFGADFKTVFYPKFSVSWVLSDEPFFPELGFVNQLRLRSAYGSSGVQPGTTAALQYYSSSSGIGESGEEPGLVFSTLGNANLKPERSTEFEAGFDASLFNDRISTEITYYNKTSRDALISRVLPPSIGTGATARLENLGEVSNQGWEFLVNAKLLQRNVLGWDVTLNGASNKNELVSLGGVPPIIGTTIQQREGFPLNGWWSRRLVSYEDKNGNGIIEAGEIVVSDTAEFHGVSMPKLEMALSSGVDFWQGRMRLSAMFDYKGGHLVYNNTERIRCASRNNCAGLIDPEASHFEQARTVMVREHASRSVAGFFEPGDFIRFREMALTMDAPQRWTNALGGRSLTATLAARNLGIVWTKYSGVDPEAFGTTGDAPSSFQAFAPPTYYTFRLSLGF